MSHHSNSLEAMKAMSIDEVIELYRQSQLACQAKDQAMQAQDQKIQA